MKSRSLIVLLSLALGATAAHAADSAKDAATKAVKSLVPQAQIEAVEAAPIAGFQQVLVAGQLIYVSNDGRYVLQGALFDASNKRDLTAARMDTFRGAKLESVPADRFIAFAPAAKPKYKITVFTDIDCGYCRKLHSHMADYNERGIEVDYLFFPRAGIGSPSYDKAVSVWCAKDRKLAMTEAKDGKDLAPAKCDNPIAKDFQLGEEVGVDGTPAIYTADGTKIGGFLTPDQLLARLQQLESAKSGS